MSHCNKLYRLILSAVFIVSGCSDGSRQESGPDPFEGKAVERLGTGSRCDRAPADLVWNGGGFVRTNANYTAHNASDCWDAYLLDLNNYQPRYTNGTRVTYGRIVPKDQAACGRTYVKGHFWRKNSDGTTTYLGTKSARGRWVTNSNVPPRCEVANFVVDRAVPGFVHGGSYRLALTAREDRATDGYDRREIVVETELPMLNRTVYDAEQKMQRIKNEITGTTVHPAFQRYFATRGSKSATMECRMAQLELSALRISERSFVQAGVSSQNAAAVSTRYNEVIQAFCGTGSLTALQFQNLFIAYFNAVNELNRTFNTLYRWPSAQSPQYIASIMGEDIQRIMAGCGTNYVEVQDFIRAGAVPAGIAGPNVLLRNCAGSPSTTQTRLGMGVNAANIQTSIRSCVINAFDEPPVEQEVGACSDPRASGDNAHDSHFPPSPDDPCVIDSFSSACLNREYADLGFGEFDNSPEKQLEVARFVTFLEYSEAAWGYTVAADRRDIMLETAAEHRARGEEQLAWAQGSVFGERLVEYDPGEAAARMAHYLEAKKQFEEAEEAEEAADAIEDRLPALEAERDEALVRLCRLDPDFEDCPWNKTPQPPADPDERCPEIDLGTGPVWFDRQDGRQLTMADRIATCTCEAMRRGTFTLTNGETSALSCMTEEERRVFDCQTNPWDEDDGGPNPLLRPECRNAFQPSGLDRDSLSAGLCDAVRCADDQTAVSAFGRCVCLDDPTSTELGTVCNFNGPAGRLDCGPTGGTLVCDALGPRCVDTNNGREPYGNNPFCRVGGRTTQLGARPAWGESTPNSFYSALTRVNSATRRAFMVNTGFQMLSGPQVFERTFDEVGTEVVFEVNQPAQLPADKGSMQAYCSNPDAGVHNVFLAQRELVAGLNTLRYPFNSSCWGDGTTPVQIAVAVRTASNQTSAAALLGMKWGGTTRAVNNPFPECGDGPDPAPVFDPVSIIRLVEAGARPGIIEGTWLRDVNFGGNAVASRVVPVDFGAFIQ